MSQEIGCVFFSGGCTIPVIRGSRLSCLLALRPQKTRTRTDTRVWARAHNQGGRVRGRDRRRSYDVSRSTNTLADTQMHKQTCCPLFSSAKATSSSWFVESSGEGKGSERASDPFILLWLQPADNKTGKDVKNARAQTGIIAREIMNAETAVYMIICMTFQQVCFHLFQEQLLLLQIIKSCFFFLSLHRFCRVMWAECGRLI